jgi:hypothetical protein
MGMEIAFIIMGLGMIAGGAYKTYQGVISKTWPCVMGTVESTEIVVFHQSTPGKRGESGYKPKITYNYLANGKPYKSSRLKFLAPNYPCREMAQKIIDKYPVNAKIPVYHNPSNPADSLILPGVTLGSLMLIPIGIILVVAGWYIHKRF